MDIIKKVKNYKAVFTKMPAVTPTNGEPDGPICGNGDLGVCLGGNSGALRFYISKNDIWCATADMYSSGMKPALILDVNAYQLANTDFYAEQHIENAVIYTKNTNGKSTLVTETCAVRKENTIIMKLTCTGEKLAVRIEPSAFTGYGSLCKYEEKSNMASISKEYLKGSDTAGLLWETKITAECKLIEKNSFDFVMEDGESVTLVMVVATAFDKENYVSWAKKRLAEIDEKNIEDLKACNDEWWNNFWNLSGISIPSREKIERFWYASHYIMACSCGNKDFPPGIFGTWLTTNLPNWGADYHLNYNHEAPWWGVYSSNRVLLAEPYDQPILDGMDNAKKFAKEYLGVNGVYYKVGIGPKGYDSCACYSGDVAESAFWGQKSNALYASINMFMRYYTTMDKEYAEKVYPFLIEVSNFWEDYIEFENGRYVIYNDYIHENPWGLSEEGRKKGHDKHHPDNDFNPLLTLALLRMYLKGMLDISEKLGKSNARREKWKHMLDNLSEYPLQKRNSKTVFRYTERGTAWWDGNSLGIQHIFPAGQIGIFSDEEQLKIATNTFEEMSRWEDYNAFPTFFTAGARIGYDAKILLKNMEAEIDKHAFPNMFVYYGGGGIECCSTVPSCINEMFMQSHQGVITLFPVWTNEDASFEKLRAYGAFIVSAELKNKVCGNVSILSEAGEECSILCPWESGMEILCDSRLKVNSKVDKRKYGTVYTFKTEKNKQYFLKKNN